MKRTTRHFANTKKKKAGVKPAKKAASKGKGGKHRHNVEGMKAKKAHPKDNTVKGNFDHDPGMNLKPMPKRKRNSK